MHGDNTVERAFQIASEVACIDEIKSRLRKEGYSNVDAHLGGPHIRCQLKALLKRSDASLQTNGPEPAIHSS